MLARLTHRAVRAVTVALLVVLAAIAALTILTIASPQTARAIDLNPIDNFCAADQHLYLPAGGDNGGTSESTVRELYKASGDPSEGDGFVTIGSIGAGAWREPGDGLSFATFGLSMCHDTPAQVATTIGDTAWSLLAVWPAKIVGLGLDWALSGALSTILLGIIQAPLEALYGSVFLAWAPLVVALTTIGIMIGIARRRGRAVGDFAWMITVLVLTGIIASPTGIAIATGATQAVGKAATCAATAPMGGCQDGQGTISSTVVDTLLMQSWGAAALGDVADEPMPATITLNEELKDTTPDIRDSYTVTIPLEAIPAGTDGVVSYADTLRWTGVYTAAEATLMRSTPEYRCSVRDRLPTIGDVTGATHKGLDPQQLCSYKALVRAALYSDLATSHPGSFASATGKSSAAMGAALSALFGLLPLLIGIALVALVALVAELELVSLFLSAPLVGLGALRSPAVGRRWATELAGSLVRRLSVGLALGIALWAVSAISVTMTKLLAGEAGGSTTAGVAITAVAPKLLPVAVAVVSALAMLGAFKLLTKLQGILLAGVGLPDAGGSGTGEERGRQVAAAAVGAAAGAVGAPGNALKGAMAGMRRGATSRGVGTAVMGGLAAGRGAGRRAGALDGGITSGRQGGQPSLESLALDREVREARAAAPAAAQQRPAPVVFPPTNVQDAASATTGLVGPRAGDHENTDQAWARLAGTVPARAHRADRDAQQAADLERAAAALRDAQEAWEQHTRTGTERAGLRAEALVRQGMSEQEAEAKGIADVAREADELKRAVNGARARHEQALTARELAGATPTRWQSAADRWARSTASLDDAAAALGLADEGDRESFATYRTMVRRDAHAGASGGVPSQRPAPDSPASTSSAGAGDASSKGKGAWWDTSDAQGGA